MRVYKLIARVGRKRQRMYPFFKAPEAGAPMRYLGWVWKPEIKEWVRVDTEKLKVTLPEREFEKPTEPPKPEQRADVPGWWFNEYMSAWEEIPLLPLEIAEGMERGTMPLFPPGQAGPSRVPGWYWSEEHGAWLEAITAMPVVEFEVPPSLPPEISMDDIVTAAVYDEEIRAVLEVLRHRFDPVTGLTKHSIDNLIRMMENCGMTEAYARNIIKQYQQLTVGLTSAEKAEVWNHASRAIYDNWRKSHRVGTSMARTYWAERVRRSLGVKPHGFEATYTTVALVFMAAAFGWLIGRLLNKVAFPGDELAISIGGRGAYLLGPGEWCYSKLIGRSAKGRPYYSNCGGIGTAYVRHKRPEYKGGSDIIDFPGGFVEEGHVGAYFVKYTWQYWTLEYVGMSARMGRNWHMLREGNTDQTPMSLAYVLPEDQWCTDFRWYL